MLRSDAIFLVNYSTVYSPYHIRPGRFYFDGEFYNNLAWVGCCSKDTAIDSQSKLYHVVGVGYLLG